MSKFDLLIVPDYNSNCYICSLINEKTTIPLYNWLCQQVLDGLSYTKTYTMLKEQMKIHYPNIKVPSRHSVWNHFKKHTKPADMVKITTGRNILKQKQQQHTRHCRGERIGQPPREHADRRQDILSKRVHRHVQPSHDLSKNAVHSMYPSPRNRSVTALSS